MQSMRASLRSKTGQRFVLVLGLAGAALSAVGAVEPVLGIVGGAVAACALLAQYRSTGAYVRTFPASAWDLHTNEGSALRIPFNEHGKRAPNVTVWEIDADDSRTEVTCSVGTEPDGTVVVAATYPFRCEVRIL